eukprot:snap_masked-scaffold_9-processed-gene-9.37-mRNA-1 protein AED:1.00 eAED:1.00 QI:0/0/0/0/1/1/2/0/225
MGNMTDEGLESAGRVVYRAFAEDGVVLPFRGCSPHYHTGPCSVYCIKDWFFGLRRAGKIYIPIHLIPIKPQKYFQTPKEETEENDSLSVKFARCGLNGKLFKSYLKNCLDSCMFLTSYVFIVKSNFCFWRNLFQRDRPWMAFLAGFMTGSACLFERKSRVSELMLFCWPKAIEAILSFGKQRGMIGNLKHLDLPVFAFSVAAMSSSNRLDYKRTYFSFWRFLIGC